MGIFSEREGQRKKEDKSKISGLQGKGRNLEVRKGRRDSGEREGKKCEKEALRREEGLVRIIERGKKTGRV